MGSSPDIDAMLPAPALRYRDAVPDDSSPDEQLAAARDHAQACEEALGRLRGEHHETTVQLRRARQEHDVLLSALRHPLLGKLLFNARRVRDRLPGLR
jgi:hypothetical protein